MCGRFTLMASPEALAREFDLSEPAALEPRYNIAPSQPVAVVRVARGQRRLELRRWGLLPRWARDISLGARLINARAETAAEKPAFREALRRRRCLVPADSFYEWRGASGSRRPYRVHLPGDRLFGLAGLYESWQREGAAPVESCALLTVEANAVLRPLHARMPVLIDREQYGAWLDPALQEISDLLPMLASNGARELEFYPVSSAVNDPRHESSACLAPAAPPEGGPG